MQTLPRPRKLYPILLQNIIPPPESTRPDLLLLIESLDYDPKINKKIIMDRCVYNCLMYKCEYSENTQKVVDEVIKKLNF